MDQRWAKSDTSIIPVLVVVHKHPVWRGEERGEERGDALMKTRRAKLMERRALAFLSSEKLA